MFILKEDGSVKVAEYVLKFKGTTNIYDQNGKQIIENGKPVTRETENTVLCFSEEEKEDFIKNNEETEFEVVDFNPDEIKWLEKYKFDSISKAQEAAEAGEGKALYYCKDALLMAVAIINLYDCSSEVSDSKYGQALDFLEDSII